MSLDWCPFALVPLDLRPTMHVMERQAGRGAARLSLGGRPRVQRFLRTQAASPEAPMKLSAGDVMQLGKSGELGGRWVKTLARCMWCTQHGQPLTEFKPEAVCVGVAFWGGSALGMQASCLT